MDTTEEGRKKTSERFKGKVLEKKATITCAKCSKKVSGVHNLRKYCDKCLKEVRREDSRKWRNNNLEKARERSRQSAKKWYENNLEHAREKSRNYQRNKNI